MESTAHSCENSCIMSSVVLEELCQENNPDHVIRVILMLSSGFFSLGLESTNLVLQTGAMELKKYGNLQGSEALLSCIMGSVRSSIFGPLTHTKSQFSLNSYYDLPCDNFGSCHCLPSCKAIWALFVAGTFRKNNIARCSFAVMF